MYVHPITIPEQKTVDISLYFADNAETFYGYLKNVLSFIESSEVNTVFRAADCSIGTLISLASQICGIGFPIISEGAKNG